MSKLELVIKEIDTVYDFYDIPMNFLFTREDKDGVFYGHWITDGKTGNPTYWVNEVTKELVRKAEKKEITLREFLTHHTISTVETWECEGETHELLMKEAQNMYKDCLPDEDVYLLD